MPGIFRPKERYWYYDEVIVLSTYNELEFQFKSRGHISKLKKSVEWKQWTLEQRCIEVQEAIKASLNESTGRKQQSTRKQALPKRLVGLIKDRREKRLLLESIVSEGNKRVERAGGAVNGMDNKLKWSDMDLTMHKAAEPEYRKEVVDKTIKIN